VSGVIMDVSDQNGTQYLDQITLIECVMNLRDNYYKERKD
jgi:predicted nucleic-acid-binding protein